LSTTSTGNNGHTLALLSIGLEDATGTDTALTLNLNNKQSAAAGNDMVITEVSAAGVETLTINADSAVTGDAGTFLAGATKDEGDIDRKFEFFD
jgi:hypothetical protein